MNPSSLYDILACPTCRTHIVRQENWLHCSQCGKRYPIINDVPIIFPDAHIPEIEHQAELLTRPTYDPWVHRTILQSMLDNQIVLEIGSGNMAIDDPCVIRMDVTYSPYVDIVGDAHALPFLPGSIDYIFSLAVFEHLRNPFEAAKSIHDVLKDGGYIYHECNFVFAYHAFPHHYFNASLQGMEQVFSAFTCLRKGIAPYQMPGFALEMILRTYLHHSKADLFPHGRKLVQYIQQILNEDLMSYDIYFSETDALYVAAGTYFSGYKQNHPESTLLPETLVQIYSKNEELQKRFPDMNNLAISDNLVRWAFNEGADSYAALRSYFDSLARFNKKGKQAQWDRSIIKGFDWVEPRYGAIGYDPLAEMAVNAAVADKKRTSNQFALILKRFQTNWRGKGRRNALRGLLLDLASRL